jgi:hypothetical protein
MTVVVKPLTNSAYGFPDRGDRRRIKPVALACVHITGNSDTASNPDLHQAARDERNYANRSGSPGPSAHHYVARDGWAIEAIDWRRYAAWSNGDVIDPNVSNPGIRRVLAMKAKGYSANEAYWLEFESVGFGTKYPITVAQRQAVAELIAEAARHSGLQIDRETVHGHWEINGVNRMNCPVSSKREAFLNDLIERALALTEDPMKYEPVGPVIGKATLKPGAKLRRIAGWTLVDLPDSTTTRHVLLEWTVDGNPGYLVTWQDEAHFLQKASVASYEPRTVESPPAADCTAIEHRLSLANDRLSRIDQLAEPV